MAEAGHALRGGRMLESKYLCAFRGFASIPTLDGSRTATEGTFALNETMKTALKPRLVRDGKRQTAFEFDQPEGISVFWGYGLRVDALGDFVPKPMAACTGAELMSELLVRLRLMGGRHRPSGRHRHPLHDGVLHQSVHASRPRLRPTGAVPG
jgi:myosin-crossreactive antigen